ncbi:MAG: twin-arginine translocase TatA/TatE family subunit [Duncaniella sp.]|uniref:Sec-independent protein translocase subunit TatA/TatB n=1 Tax=Duncaniella sp. TaxID=2518496 RepID=UPI0023C30887|nr:twin-arginine translocase TatA/TatE family subunit [Duncaniella sp.]MDE5988254.1 twin-arginine translocase TatA/TatE family subunit [Duncaniella sp.]
MTPCIFNLGTGEIIVILVVVLLLFGAKRIPELARGLGKGISQFKQGMNDAVSEIKDNTTDNPDKTSGTK